MSTDQQPISDDEIRDVMGWLNEALSTTGAEARHERVGRAVRTLTRLWSEKNPAFDGDAWYPISAMLTEHWTQISDHMSSVDLQPASDPPADQKLDAHHSSSPDRGGNVHRALNESLSGIGSSFQPDELAFLAATSKVELPIRDRLAWNLQRLIGEEFIVAREWRRADLAVLAGEGVVAQLEAKALYSFNVLQPANRKAYLDRLIADAAKMAALAASDRYLLSMLVDVRGEIRPDLNSHVVKYSSGIAAGIKASGETVRTDASDLWLDELAGTFDSPTEEMQVDGGRVWGLDVSVDLFLTGPLPPV